MAARQKHPTNDTQLDLFSSNGVSYERANPVRTDGRETLARVPPEDGGGTRSEGNASPDALRGPGEDQGRDVRSAHSTDETGPDTPASPGPSLGDDQGTLHPSSIRRRIVTGPDEPVRNQANYRITDSDQIGGGSLKQKLRQNLAAIRVLRSIEGEQRPANNEEKSVLVKYVGWGGLPQVF